MVIKALIDSYGRQLDYVRFAVTDRCNLRCFYCMPESGIQYAPKSHLCSYEELIRIFDILSGLGVKKVRITGGEPFLRKDVISFMQTLADHPTRPSIHITTNGTLTAHYIEDMVAMGISSVNLSLDTLDEGRFRSITRREGLSTVLDTLHQLAKSPIRTKINMVVMGGLNDEDIIPMAALAEEYPVEVRYIEEMPFNGEGVRDDNKYFVDYQHILDKLRTQWPSIQAIPSEPNATANTYQIDGFQGNLGIIPAFSRTFCGTCNRLRITPEGLLKTCLYDRGVFNVKDLIRAGATDAQIEEAFIAAASNKAKDGWEAQKLRTDHWVSESMSTIGG